MAMAAAGRCLLLSRPSSLRLRVLRATLSTAASPSSSPALAAPEAPPRHELLLERLRFRHLKDSSPAPPKPLRGRGLQELGLEEEVLAAIREADISKPAKIQCLRAPPLSLGDVANGDGSMIAARGGSWWRTRRVPPHAPAPSLSHRSPYAATIPCDPTLDVALHVQPSPRTFVSDLHRPAPLVCSPAPICTALCYLIRASKNTRVARVYRQ